MLVIRSDRFKLNKLSGGLVHYRRIGYPSPMLAPLLKYVDVDTQMVFIINPKEKSPVIPTYATVLRFPDYQVIDKRMEIERQLNVTSHDQSGMKVSLMGARP